MLQIKNPHSRDCLISFDPEPHVYYYKNDKSFHSSVTSFVKEFFSKFDDKQDSIIDKLIKKNYDNKQSIYYQKTVKEIKDMWNNNKNEAAKLGTKLHYCIEQFYNDNYNTIEESVTNTKEWEYFKNFQTNNKHLEAYRTEWEVFDEELDIAGSIDMVFKEDDKYHIYDWKRSKEIKTKGFGNDFGKEPIEHIQNANYWHYSLQLNMYKYILEKNYGIKIDEMHIIVFHPNFENYIDYQLPDLSSEIMSLVESRKRIFLQMQHAQSTL